MRLIRTYATTLTWYFVIILATKLIFWEYLYLNNVSIGAGAGLKSLAWGFRFDAAVAACGAYIVTVLYPAPKYRRGLFAFFSAFFWTLQISDIIYFAESGRHIGYELKDALSDGGGLIGTAMSNHTGLFILGVAGMCTLPVLTWKRLPAVGSTGFSLKHVWRLALLSGVTVFFIRGMFAHIPLNPWQAIQVGDERQATLSLTGSYSALFSVISGKALKPVPLPASTATQLDNALKHVYGQPQQVNFQKLPEKTNVVFILLESWSAELMHSYGAPHTSTPFFDELLKKSIRPKAMIANGHRTTEGMFAVFASYQNPLGKTVAKSPLQANHYMALPHVLTERGYDSAFFQGSAKETSGTGSFAQQMGFKNSWGKEDIRNCRYEHNDWGVYDQDLYTFVLEKTARLTKPFVIGVNTNTTHASQIPKGVTPIKFTEDAILNARLNALHFADKALGDFVTTFEKTYPNTLFVLLADHTAGVNGSPFLHYLIPCAFYSPGLSPLYRDTYLSQRDTAPTVLDLLGLNYRTVAPHFTGTSLVSDSQAFADYYHNGTLGWIEGDSLVEINAQTGATACSDVSSLKQMTVPCSPENGAARTRAIALSAKFQQVLFSGKTPAFSRKESDKKNQ